MQLVTCSEELRTSSQLKRKLCVFREWHSARKWIIKKVLKSKVLSLVCGEEITYKIPVEEKIVSVESGTVQGNG